MGGSGGEGAGEGGGGSGNSKARTVEAAIEYIQMLKGEVRELKGRLEAVEKEKEIDVEGTDTVMVNEDNGGMMSSHENIPTQEITEKSITHEGTGGPEISPETVPEQEITPEIIKDNRTTPHEQKNVTETEAETEA